MAKESVIVIGGGVAGIGAAVRLLRQGYKVTLVERRGFLGGRAYSYNKTDAPPLDNGLHVTLGCYNYYLDLLKTLDAEDPIEFQKEFAIVYRGCLNGKSVNTTVKALPLPAPWHLFFALLRTPEFSLKDVAYACRMGGALWQRHRVAANVTVTQWLDQLKQPTILRELFWQPITHAALNRHVDFASAKLLAEVLFRTFLKQRRLSAIGIFKKNLSNVHGRPAERFIRHNGGSLILKQGIRKLLMGSRGIEGLITDDGQQLRADYYISAVPHYRFMDWVDEEMQRCWPESKSFAALGTSAIINIYLRYTDKPLADPFVCLLGSQVEWVFDVSSLSDSKYLLSFTISDANRYLEKTTEELANLAHVALRSLFPTSCPEKYDKAWVTKERRATMEHTPENEQYRPGVDTPFSNLLLAGDWTHTGLPCTLEGATQSGYCAADRLIEQTKGITTR